MRTHIIESGVVIDTINATVEEAQVVFPNATCIEATEGGIGWEFDGSKLINSEIAIQSIPATESITELVTTSVATTPRIIKSWQGRVILHRLGILETIVSYFSGLATGELAEDKIKFDYANEWSSDWSALVDALHSVGVQDEQISQIFNDASIL